MVKPVRPVGVLGSRYLVTVLTVASNREVLRMLVNEETQYCSRLTCWEIEGCYFLPPARILLVKWVDIRIIEVWRNGTKKFRL